MVSGGFIDPGAEDRRRLDKLDGLIDLLFDHVGLNVLSPNARAVYDDLTSDDPARIARARQKMHTSMARDPLLLAKDDPIIEALKDAQHERCLYGTREGDGRTCDCKFHTLFGSNSEATGCAELRVAIWVLTGDRQWKAVEDR